MAESDIINDEDMIEISSVLQLAPHQKNTTFTTVTKTEDGDLVSLDELYEKTGQEAIDTFIKGFDLLVNKNKLGRKHAMALNIKGAESWMIIPDNINAIRGGEGFFSAVKDGIVAIVKAIIAFIEGIYTWIMTRIKALLGWGKTSKETEYLHDHSEDVKFALCKIIRAFGVSIDQEFFDTLPDGVTLTEMFSITKTKIEDNKEAFIRLGKASEYIKDYKDVFNKWTSEIKNSKREYDRLMTGMRNKVRNKLLTIGDLNDFTLTLHEINNKHTDTRKITRYLDGLIKALYGIELHGLGENNDFKKIREQLEKDTEQVKISYNPSYAESIRQGTIAAYANMFGDKKGSTLLRPELLKELKKIVNVKDSEFIKEVEKKYPDLQLSAAYAKFSHGISTYTGVLEYFLKLIQNIEISINNMIRWKDKASCLLTAYVTNDVLTILAAHDKYLTQEQRNKIEKLIGTGKYKKAADGTDVEIMKRVPIITDNFQNIFFKDNPDAIFEKVSDGMNIFMDTEYGKKVIDNFQRFKNQLKG